MKRLTALAAGLILCAHCAFAQHVVSGVVMDGINNTPLPGVTIRNMQNETGSTSQTNGHFTINADSSDTLVISFMGYISRKIPAGKNDLLIRLQPSFTSLNELIVTASREVQRRTEAPVAIDVISSEMIRQTKPVTLDQVLNKVSGVYMVDLGNEQHTMAIRQPIGYRSNFLYLQDGIPIRAVGDFNHNALIEINQAAIKNIEVVKGPSSSLYGSDAVGGVVNFITKAPAAVPDANVSLEGSNWGYRRADFTASNTFQKTGVLLSGYYARQHDGYMDHSDFHKLALTGRVDRTLSEKTKLSGTITWIDYHTDMNGGLDSAHFYGKDYQSFYTFNYRKVNALRARITLDQKWTATQHSSLTLYFRHNAIGQNPSYYMKNTDNPLKARGEVNKDYFQSYGILAQHTWKLPKWDTRIMGGMHAAYSPAGYIAHFIAIDKNNAGYFTRFSMTDSLLTDYAVNMLNAAGYVQLQTSPIPKMRLVAGLRYDRLSYDFNNHLTPSAYTGAPDERNHFSQLTPKVGVTYDFGVDRGAYLNYSIGFAPPDISDLYHGVKVPYLKPARYYNKEMGGRYSFDNHKGYADVSVYQMNGTNEIIAVRLPDGSYMNENAGKTAHYGIEYTLKYKPVSQWQFRVSGTNARHKFIDYKEAGKNYNGNEMNGAPHWIMNAEATYFPGFLPDLNLAVEWQHLSSYFMDPENTQRYKGYDVFNVRLNYQWHQFACWLHLINGTNAIYATTAEKTAYGVNYRPGPLRTLYFGVSYHFSGTKNKKN